MTISTRFGEVAIVAKHGIQQAKYFPSPDMLVTVEYPPEGDLPSRKRYYWALFLYGDYAERERAIESAPLVILSSRELKRAMLEAE